MNNSIAEQDKKIFKKKIIISTTKRFIEVKHYLDWYCDRYGGYYDLPLYGPVFILVINARQPGSCSLI